MDSSGEETYYAVKTFSWWEIRYDASGELTNAASITTGEDTTAPGDATSEETVDVDIDWDNDRPTRPDPNDDDDRDDEDEDDVEEEKPEEDTAPKREHEPVYLNTENHYAYIAGYADGTFRPNAYITRAEAVTLINRMLDRTPDANHLLADMVRWPDNPETAWYYADIQEATNSHDYTRAGTGDYEVWTELLANRDWAALEEIWSQANDAPGGEVMG